MSDVLKDLSEAIAATLKNRGQAQEFDLVGFQAYAEEQITALATDPGEIAKSRLESLLGAIDVVCKHEFGDTAPKVAIAVFVPPSVTKSGNAPPAGLADLLTSLRTKLDELATGATSANKNPTEKRRDPRENSTGDDHAGTEADGGDVPRGWEVLPDDAPEVFTHNMDDLQIDEHGRLIRKKAWAALG